MAVEGVVRSHECASPREKVVFISLKQAIHHSFVQFRESDTEPLYKQTSQRKAGTQEFKYAHA